MLVFTDKEEDVRLWFPVLTGLGGLAADSRLFIDLRTSALGALFSILMQYGHHFSAQLWGIVSHGVLLPLFEDVHHLEELGDTTWLRTQLAPAIDHMTKLCVAFMPAVSQPLGDFLKGRESEPQHFRLSCEIAYYSFVKLLVTHRYQAGFFERFQQCWVPAKADTYVYLRTH